VALPSVSDEGERVKARKDWRVSSDEDGAKLLREAKRADALMASSLGQQDQEAAEVWKDRKRQVEGREREREREV
jgi:hypothetical protein